MRPLNGGVRARSADMNISMLALGVFDYIAPLEDSVYGGQLFLIKTSRQNFFKLPMVKKA